MDNETKTFNNFSKLEEAVIQYQKSQIALLELLKRVVEKIQENQESMLKLKENKTGLDEFFKTFDDYRYQIWNSSFRKMFTKKI